ncbi:MAG: SpoIIE family protein phosphatase [Oscillibacter sp.]|nr:SpoIIE family protein phosphatase [Oscillibacter sp.]
MKFQKQGIATAGLIFITFLSAIQYVFLRNVPDTVSTFAFVCVTNLIGLLILASGNVKKLFQIRGETLKKGMVFAVELTGFNVFLLIGSRHLDAVIISSAVSLYFVFITPMLLLMGKKVNFFSGIATIIAIISLLLMFGVDTDTLFSSLDVVYLILADIFFAAYVVSVSVLGADEDSAQLTLTQMAFSALLGFVGWAVEGLFLHQGFSMPQDVNFWISAIFIGVFIRAVYGLLQITCQKYVSALKASLIFSAEIIITLLTNPILCGLLGMEYTQATVFQVMGGALLIVATLMVDDTVMARLGYSDLQETTYVNSRGQKVTRYTVARKVILTTLTFAMVTLVLSTLTFLSAIYLIRASSVESSQALGESASSISAEAMMQKLEESIRSQAEDKALLAEEKLSDYSNSTMYAASYAASLYREREEYPFREVERPMKENAGVWTMQRTLANPDVSYETLREESGLLGNMLDVFSPIVRHNDNIATVYMGTQSGLLISYDPYSDAGEIDGESYYEYRDSVWYQLGKSVDGYAFTEAYQDSYGRGLTITCVAPFTDADGRFAGCVAMDILMSELNASMVNDGIVEPSVATLINERGEYIAGRDVDPLAEDMGSVFDKGSNPSLTLAANEILENKNGIVSVGEGEEADYIAYATIASTNWTLCILSPVSAVIEPAIVIRENIEQNTQNVVNSVVKGIMNVIQSCLLLSALILLFVTLFVGRFSRRISDPLKMLEQDVRQISGGNLDQRTDVTTDDEIGSLADSFNHMTDSLQKYIADLTEATAKEERLVGELSAATTIQASMLPRDFEDFSRNQPFELYASMSPAKEVGGDFYDFFMIDDKRLCMVIADVSGKGVPAALFMVIAKTLIKTRALMGGGPSEILKYVNQHLCESNEEDLFVTVWLAILDLSTGKGLAANAGHEHPAIRRAGGKYELSIYRHSLAVAAMEGIRFPEHEFELHPGDSLFVYTDGVAEATDVRDELYGTDRMLAALNRNADAPPQGLLKAVRKDIDAFVKEAPQFDDITMLSFHYEGGEES